VEIPCPADCGYLRSSQAHPPSVVKRRQEQDIAALMSVLGRLSQPQMHLFFLLASLVARHQSDGLAPLVDQDLADAVKAVAESLETASKGLIYEATASSLPAEGLRREIKAFLAQIGEGGGSRFERDAAEVLRGVERGARHESPLIGATDTAYLSLIRRVVKAPDRGREPAALSSLIMP
jgi:hypothetical protein